MAESKHQRWRLPPQALLIALLPATVLVGSDFLLTQHGWPILDGIAAPTPVADAAAAHAEAAARLRMIAGFLLFAGAAAAAAGYFAILALSVDRISLASIFSAAVAIVLICGVYFETASPDQTQELVGQRFVCAAASMPAKISLLPPGERPELKSGSRPRIAADVPEFCAADRFAGLRNLIETERLMLFAAIPAVIFGAILCLAGPFPPKSRVTKADKESHRNYLEMQIGRLNTVLYLSAFLMVGGLLFLSAFLHYPAFLFSGRHLASFQQHVGSLVLYYAVSYSLLIAAFYVPVAAVLAGECALLKQRGGDEPQGTGMLAPVQMLKVGAAIFSPLIAGSLGEFLAFPS